MQARAASKIFRGVSGVSLMLPFSLLIAAQSASANAPSVLRGEWKQIASQRLTPNYSWAQPAPVGRRSSTSRLGLRAEVVFPLRLGGQTVEVGFANQFDNGVERFEQSTRWGRQRGQFAGFGFGESILTPGLSASVGASRFTVEAILARQQYSSFGLGLGQTVIADRNVQGLAAGDEVSTGSGIAATWEFALNDRIALYTSARTQVDMDPLQRHRGLYGDPGDFDIPAGAGAGLSTRLTNNSWLQLGVERVFYSDVQGFTSQSLPRRFLNLLGDSTSPVFEWQDLTVYSASIGMQPSEDWTLELRYSTQQQPEPTSALLRRALEDEFTDQNFALGVTRRVGDASQLTFNASYAAREYVLGMPTYQANAESGEQIEFEAVWQVLF